MIRDEVVTVRPTRLYIGIYMQIATSPRIDGLVKVIMSLVYLKHTYNS